MMLEGRIVGVRMSKSTKVEYMFQPEGIVEVLPEEKFPPQFMIKRDKDRNKRYPLVRFTSPFAPAGEAKTSEEFSLGYLLAERKELVRINCQGMTEAPKGAFAIEVDSVCIGHGFEKEAN